MVNNKNHNIYIIILRLTFQNPYQNNADKFSDVPFNYLIYKLKTNTLYSITEPLVLFKIIIKGKFPKFFDTLEQDSPPASIICAAFAQIFYFCCGFL